MLLIQCLSLAVSAFQRLFGSTQQTRSQRIRIPPEPETRNGLSLARNDAFATITRSMLLTCPFESTQILAQIRSISGSPLGSVSKPKPGEFVTFDPLSSPRPCVLMKNHRLHSPSGNFRPPDQSVQRASSIEARFTGRSICLLLP